MASTKIPGSDKLLLCVFQMSKVYFELVDLVWGVYRSDLVNKRMVSKWESETDCFHQFAFNLRALMFVNIRTVLVTI